MFMSMLEKDKKAPVDYGYGPGAGIGPREAKPRPRSNPGNLPIHAFGRRKQILGAAPLAGGGGCGARRLPRSA